MGIQNGKKKYCTKVQKVSNTVFWKLEASQEPIDKLVHKATLLLHSGRNFQFLPKKSAIFVQILRGIFAF